MHRRDLQGALQRGVDSLPDQIKFQLHTALVEVDYTPTPEGKTRFKVKRNVAPPTDPESAKAAAGGKAEEQQLDREEVWLEADLVIAADGIRSVARRDMLKKLGEEDHSMYNCILLGAWLISVTQLKTLDKLPTESWCTENRYSMTQNCLP